MLRFCVLLLGLLGLLPVGVTCAQGAAPRLPSPLRLLDSQARSAAIPLRIRRNLLLVPVWLNGRGPFQFVLDTGVETTLLTDPAVRDSLRLPPGEPLLVAGAGEDAAFRASLVAGVRIGLPGVAPAPLPLAVLSGDALELSRYVGEPVAGLIGADLFRSFVVELRGGRGSLRLHDPARWVPPRRRWWQRRAVASVPLLVRGGKPYLQARLQQQPVGDGPSSPADTLHVRLLIDTGAGHALSLERGVGRGLRLPANRLRVQVGRGLSGAINGYLGRVAALRVGPFAVRAPLTAFPDSAAVLAHVQVPRAGTVGLELLKRFHVWFDYGGRTLWLRPAAGFNEPFEYDMSGLEIVAHGPAFNRFVVVHVEPDGPGAEAGLAPGDELVILDGRPASEFSLTTLSALLRSQDGRRLLVLARRADGGGYVTVLTLRRVL